MEEERITVTRPALALGGPALTLATEEYKWGARESRAHVITTADGYSVLLISNSTVLDVRFHIFIALAASVQRMLMFIGLTCITYIGVQ